MIQYYFTHYVLFALYVFSSLIVLYTFLEKLLKRKKGAAVLSTFVIWLMLPSGLYFDSVLLNILGLLGIAAIVFVIPIVGLISVFVVERKLKFRTALMTLFLAVYPFLSSVL